jgi:hypothetical protein
MVVQLWVIKNYLLLSSHKNIILMNSNQFKSLLSAALLGTCFLACQNKESASYQFQVSDLEKHIITLSSDAFMGRMPFTEGEEITIKYLENEFKTMGLEPGNGDSYFQDVPMVSITTNPSNELTIKSESKELKLEGLKDFVLWTQRTDEVQNFEDIEIVFAGFGIVAPEYGWNDYKNIDVKDKIVMVLVNDPGFGTEEAALFKGNTMTYYGRWTYKFEEAARQGALGTLIVHNTIPAGYGFNVIQNSWNAPKLYLDSRGKEIYNPVFEGWITLPIANQLFEMAGLNEREMLAQARRPDFQAIPLNLKASSSMEVEATYDISKNVIAKITGSKRPDEYII